MAAPTDVLHKLNDPTARLSDVLRLCLQLPASICDSSFLAWVRKELDGYADPDGVPSYRVLVLESRGIASNLAYRHSDLPVNDLPGLNPVLKQLADTPEHLFQGVAALEDLIAQANSTPEGAIAIEWPMSAVMMLNIQIAKGEVPIHKTYHFDKIWKPIPRSRVIEALDQVRTRIAAELGPSAPSTEETPPSRSHTISVQGSHNQLTVQSTGSTQWQLTLEAGDREGLVANLRDQGVSDIALKLLDEILDSSDPEPTRLKTALEWAKSQALGLGTGTATAAISTLILRHFGLA